MSQALLSYEDAVALVAAQAAKLALRKPRTERVALEQAVGRVLARPIIADRDQPAFARSTRDGFACRAAEINVAINEKASAHLPLVVAGSSRAGDVPGGPLPAGAAWEIMTGAPMPSGADAVVMIEHVALKKNHVRLLEPRSLHAGQNVVARAAQGRKGDELLAAGVTLTWAQIALAAACGVHALPFSPPATKSFRSRPSPVPARFATPMRPCWRHWWQPLAAIPGCCPLRLTMPPLLIEPFARRARQIFC
jgi:molybdopterin molybdotransferase